jgi:hypothetical protein
VTTDDERIRAFLDHEAWWESLADEQQDAIKRRRRILGSLEDTHALNRSERGGGAITLAFFAAAFAPLAATHYLGLVLAVALSAAICLVWVVAGCCMAGAGTRERLDAEAPGGGER